MPKRDAAEPEGLSEDVPRGFRMWVVASQQRSKLSWEMGRAGWISILTLIVSAVVLTAYVVLSELVEREAERVTAGHNVNGLGLLVPFIDVRANRANVMWLDPEKTPPTGLEDAEYVAYLGSGGDMTVLLACGETTYLVQSSDVAVTLAPPG
jgi:hypothetical protein